MHDRENLFDNGAHAVRLSRFVFKFLKIESISASSYSRHRIRRSGRDVETDGSRRNRSEEYSMDQGAFTEAVVSHSAQVPRQHGATIAALLPLSGTRVASPYRRRVWGSLG